MNRTLPGLSIALSLLMLTLEAAPAAAQRGTVVVRLTQKRLVANLSR
jgi:hypothetical protein